MNAEINEKLRGKTVAVAVSGGVDSMSLLHFAVAVAETYRIKVVALNVEHGIRGETSCRDTFFVKEYCKSRSIPFIGYSVDVPKKAREEKLSVEQAARILRYECFFDAINGGKCDAVLTAHHSSDNLESVLFNLFRGTGVKGLCGIKDYDGKIFRPFIKVSKSEILEYAQKNGVPFVNDETNFCDDYSRNFLRLNVIPKIKELFPEAEQSVIRLAETLSADDDFLDGKADDALTVKDGVCYIALPLHRAVLARAVIKALKTLGLKKDYEKVHVDDVCALAEKENGKAADLPLGIRAAREYDRITLFCATQQAAKADGTIAELSFWGKFSGENKTAFTLCGKTLTVCPADKKTATDDLKNGFYADADKIPKNAVIRFRKSGDRITKFGGGTKSLSDFFTDKKIPLKDRDGILLIASENNVLAVQNVAISDKIKMTNATRDVIKIL
ncbi:MAG: tRNA lysidine(34) synthetase TilS [Clostridia bacterium]|nr:tRNA lysidine(34) synthetase TilS [Clostridia bacterium]